MRAPALLLLAAACGQSANDVAGVYVGRLNIVSEGSTDLQQAVVRLSAGRGDQDLSLNDGFCRSLKGALDDEALSFAAGECQKDVSGEVQVWRPSGGGRVRLGILSYDLAGPRVRTPAGGEASTDTLNVRFVGDWAGP